MLFAREFRKASSDNRGGELLNFLGGKRREEKIDPLTCAIDKFVIETGGCIDPRTIESMRIGNPIVCWSSNSKYVLYIFELDECFDMNTCSIDITKGEVKKLEWVKGTSITEVRHAQTLMHDFSMETLVQLLDCNIIQHMEALFEVAMIVDQPFIEDYAAKAHEKVTADMNAHYDLVRLLNGVKTAYMPTLSNTPSFKELQSYIKEIPVNNIEKLKSKMHPDWLQRILKRAPQEDDLCLVMKATEVLNMLITGGNNEKEVMDG